MPTMKQVNEMITALAEEFDFSDKEARIFLKLPIEVVNKPSAKNNTSQPAKPRGRPPKCSTDTCKTKVEKSSPTTTRGPSAYNMFVKAESSKVKAALLTRSNGAKLEQGEVMKELGAKWKAMSDKQKAKYIDQTKK